MQFRFATREQILEKLFERLGTYHKDFIVQSIDRELANEVGQITHDFRCHGSQASRIEHWVEMFNGHSYSRSKAQMFCIMVLDNLNVEELCKLFGNHAESLIITSIQEGAGKDIPEIIHGFKNCGHPEMHLPYWVKTFHEYAPQDSEAQAFCVQVIAALEDNLIHLPQVLATIKKKLS